MGLSEKLTEDIIAQIMEKSEKRMDGPSPKSGTRGKDYANENSAR